MSSSSSSRSSFSPLLKKAIGGARRASGVGWPVWSDGSGFELALLGVVVSSLQAASRLESSVSGAYELYVAVWLLLRLLVSCVK